MKSSCVSIIAALSVVATALPNKNVYDLDSQEVASGVTWTGQVHPGKTVTFTGTVQQIQDQITAINPTFFGDSGNVNATDVESGENLAKRWTEKQEPDCTYGNWMERTEAVEGINYLNGNKGGKMMCGAPPAGNGRGGCSRVSCQDDSGIWLCNDENVEIRLPCSEVGSAALELSNVCYRVQEGGNTETRGQLFTTANWNVIMRKTVC